MQLRESIVANAKNVEDLLEPFMKGLTHIPEEIYGEGVLIIFEGWDDLQHQKRCDSIFTRIIDGKDLPKAKILLTTRSSASNTLVTLDSRLQFRWIEILGYRQENT